jgi:hypothetical protein
MEDQIDFKQHAKKKYEDPKFPGNIKVGVYPGCAVKVFSGGPAKVEEEITEFFKANNGCIVADWKMSGGPNGDNIGITLFYTILLSEEQREVLNIRTEVMEKMVQEQVDALNAQHEEEEKRQEEEKRREQALIMRGKKCEHDHGGIDKEREALNKLRKIVKKEAPKLLEKVKLDGDA